MGHNPLDLFLEWLTGRPAAARMAVAVDGDRLLADAGQLGKEKLRDNGAREWRLVVFRGDDIAFRLAFRSARKANHVLIVLARGANEEKPINVSYLTDILSANEGGEPFDFSLPAVFRRLCPQINFPIAELRRFKSTLLVHLDRVPEAAQKLIERWHRPDDWGRAQVAAFALLLRHPNWTLREIWPDELDPASAVAHALQALLLLPADDFDHATIDSSDLKTIRELLPGALRDQVQEHRFWLDAPVDEVAAYLVLRKYAGDVGLQNPAVQLSGLQIFPRELPVEKFETLTLQVIARLQSAPQAWRSVERRAEEFLTPRRAARVGSLVGASSSAQFIGALSSPALLLPYLQRRLLEFFANPQVGDLTWTDELSSNSALKADGVDLTDRRLQCAALARLAGRIQLIEGGLAMAVPQFSHVEQLLDWYIDSGHHRLELEAARGVHDAQACHDEELSIAARHYLLGAGDELTRKGSLLYRVRQRLDELDVTLSQFILASPDKFATGPRSFVGFIKEELRGELTPILTGDSDKRIWVLIFDGMRYDTWESVVQPLLGVHFQISGQPRFCTIPSYTLYARRSVLAGGSPAAWLAGKSAASHPEPQLFADNLGLGRHEVHDKIRLVTDADTTVARSATATADADVRPLNVLIYPISDECHEYRGDLAKFNDKIRQDLLGDRHTGIRGILDDLLLRVKPGDVILATSDHGFVELPPDAAVQVSNKEAAGHQATLADTVFYRYAKQFTPASLPASVAVEVAGEFHALCVGRTWLKREGIGQTVRYSHGGVSLAELVVPAFRLERVTAKIAAVEISDLPVSIAVDEDAETEIAFTLHNRGNMDAEFEVSARSNLDQPLLELRDALPPAGNRPIKFRIQGMFRTRPDGTVDSGSTVTAIGIRLRHTDQSGKWRDAVDGIINLAVTVHARKTKLETDALAGFDEV